MIKIPIVFAVDINMISQTFVSIGSVLEHRREEYELDFFIMIPDEKTQEKGNKYISVLKDRFDNFGVTYILINDLLFKNVKDTTNGITKTAMYRILIPNYLMEYDKCLYFDSDILVYGDIIELFREDLGDNYIAGSLALFDTTAIKIRLGMEIESNYINSGVLLLNLKKLREDKMVDVFLNTMNSDISNFFIMQDQDLINICCINKIKIFSPRYNIQISELVGLKSTICKLYPKNSESIWAEIQHPIVLHFTGEWLKPWKCPFLKLSKGWWKTAEWILSSEESVQMWNEGKKYISGILFSELLSKIKNASDIVIFGFSVLSNQLMDSLINNGVSVVRGFCDNDRGKQGMVHQNIVCLSVEDASKKWRDAFYIISVQTRRKDIEEQLMKYGIKKKNIIQYTKKIEGLPELMEEEFRERLLEDEVLERSSGDINKKSK